MQLPSDINLEIGDREASKGMSKLIVFGFKFMIRLVWVLDKVKFQETVKLLSLLGQVPHSYYVHNGNG